MTPVLIAIAFAAFNRARGTRFWDVLPSTVVGRLLATMLMASSVFAITGVLWVLPATWAALMLWCTPAWDNYWSAAIGNPTNISKPAFAPVDWIMRRLSLPVVTGFQLRLWGAVAMGLRQSLAIPAIVITAVAAGHPINALNGLATLSFGFLYMAAGYLPNRYSIAAAEYATGAALGLILFASIQ
jgi:hypothetical protein